jgi:hypothetical protein
MTLYHSLALTDRPTQRCLPVAVKYVPEWFPGARFKQDARLLKELGHKVVHGPFDFAKKSRVCVDYLSRCATFNGL